jgi:hypothetical protein
MKLDELLKQSEDVAVAVVREEDDSDWNVYIINLKKAELTNVMVTSNGYGEVDNKNLKTSTLRFFFDSIPADSFAIVEPIVEEVFPLNNEYWVSYYVNDNLYDKKFVFLPESIQEANMISVPIVNKRGVLIK